MNRFVFLTMRVKIFLIISAGLCFSLVADAKAVKIPQWIFGFTFGAPVAVQRAQCKALKGTWNYKFDVCEDLRLVGFDPECDTSASGKRIEFEDGTVGNTFSFLTFGSNVTCGNKWLEWAHVTFGEPSCKNDEGDKFWWERSALPYDEVVGIMIFKSGGTSVWFYKTTHTDGVVCDDLE